MSGEIVKCALCGLVFETTWTEEEAQAEMEDNFGDVPEERQVIVCEECHQKLLREHAAPGGPV